MDIPTNIGRTQSSGSSQAQRYPVALRADYAQLDERSIVEHIGFLISFAKEVTYYNTKNQKEGHWQEFFLQDEIILLTAMANIKMEQTQLKYAAITDDQITVSGVEGKRQKAQKLMTLLTEIAISLDFWYKRLTLTYDPKDLVPYISNSIAGSLSQGFNKVLASSFWNEPPGTLPVVGKSQSLRSLSDRWKLVFPSGRASESRVSEEDLKVLISEMKEVFYTFNETFLYLRNLSEEYLHNALEHSQNSRPNIALIITFLRLMQYPKDLLNSITKKHRDYYYKEVLGQTKAPERPDITYVYFSLAKEQLPYYVKKGVSLTAGKDALGKPLFYETTSGVLVTGAKLAGIRTFFLRKDKFSVPEGVEMVSGLFTAEPPIDGSKRWATFGEDQFYKGDNQRTMADARMGFALASPVLLLSEGRRHITLDFELTQSAFHRLLQQLDDTATKRKSNRASVFFQVFAGAFQLSLTTAEGWLENIRYAPLLDEENERVSLLFNLSTKDPAITPYLTDVHGGDFDTEWPLLQFMLKKEGAIHAYSFLKEMELKNAAVNASVEGIKSAVLFNKFGPLPPDGPFMPLGVLPGPGDYFLIGYKELLVKELTQLSFQLGWANLPKSAMGFADYFKGYDEGLSNSSFKVQLSALKDGLWSPAEEKRQTFNLFDWHQPDALDSNEKLLATTDFDTLELERFQLQPTSEVPEALEYTKLTQEGFFKMELVAPEIGFGQSVYGEKLTQVNLKNAAEAIRTKGQGFVPIPEPKPPFVPEANSFLLNYGAVDYLYPPDKNKREETKSRCSLFHLHPFGTVKLRSNSAKIENTLLPNYEDGGYLYLEIKDMVLPGPISLFFHLSEGTINDKIRSVPQIKWAYLTENGWEDLNPKKVLSDGTSGFVRTGIITLELPADLSTSNPLMPAGNYWIKASMPRHAELASKTIGLHLNAAPVKWEDRENDKSHLQKPLPAGVISSFEIPIPAIAEVVQPVPSIDGDDEEKEDEFTVRVSERLRHKQRAIVAWDYERLILDRFPHIRKVRCFQSNYASGKSEIAPGKVLIVVTPDIRSIQVVNPLRPKVSMSQLLEVRDYIQQYASPFVQMEVANPFYERIRVVCAVRFDSKASTGEYVRKLNGAITTFLAPWTINPEAEEELGSSMFKSDILGFIENQDYVQFVTRFSVVKTEGAFEEFKLTDSASDTLTKHKIGYEIKTEKPWSLLTSADEHSIEVIDENKYEQAEPRAIGNMKLGMDFIVEDETKNGTPERSNA